MESASAKQIKKQQRSSTTQGIRKSKKTKINIQEIFNNLRVYPWINLSTMIQNNPYLITSLKKHETKFGSRLLALLDNQVKFYLPERYNVFTEKQIQEMGSSNYVLVNKGIEGKSHKLEILHKDAIDLSSHTPPPPPPHKTPQQQQQVLPPPEPESMIASNHEPNMSEEEDESSDNSDEENPVDFSQHYYNKTQQM